MRRDMDLIRELLLEIEENTTPSHCLNYDDDGSNNYEKHYYHLVLMKESGLIVAIEEKSATSRIGMFKVYRLTSKGHDLLDDARNEKVWNEALKKIGDKTATVSLSVLQSLLVAVTKNQLGL